MGFGEDNDSGMSSQNSKSETPEKVLAIEGSGDDLEDEEDETLAERLWGLTEMFPDPVRRGTDFIFSTITSTIKWTYNMSRHGAWIMASSSLLLIAPVMFEVERANAIESMRRDQQQVLLGPNAGGPPPTR